MPSDHFVSAFADVELKVLHYHPKSPLRAWSAADELAIKYVSTLPLSSNASVLVVNDTNGALALSLHQFKPDSWGDHDTARKALLKNLVRNSLPEDQVTFIPSTSSLFRQYDVVVIQLPKTLSLLEAQLVALRPHVAKETVIIGCGMVKHMAKAMIGLFEKVIGPTHTSLAEKKARLVFASFDELITPPTLKDSRYGIPNSPLILVNQSNVFSRQKLDVGTRFFIENFPNLEDVKSVLDLGCGNGALGVYAGWKYSPESITFVDESYLAVQSAKKTVELNDVRTDVRLMVADALEGEYIDSVDVVLCNPPFHEGNKVHTDIAQRMFVGAARCLKEGGKLYVVANRHLPYTSIMKKYFSQVSLVSGNAKFVILCGEK